MKKILIAGIGNIFDGDDAFGCEVIRALAAEALPTGVAATDYGIRGYDLAYALTSDYDLVILIDTAPRGKEPGTLYLIEPDLTRVNDLGAAAADAHSMNPVTVIQMAQAMGGIPGNLFLVGCEPAILENYEGKIGFSPAVQAAVPRAVEMIKSLVSEMMQKQPLPEMAEAK